MMRIFVLQTRGGISDIPTLPIWKTVVYFCAFIACSYLPGISGCKNCTGLQRVQVVCSSANDNLLKQLEKFGDDGNSTLFCSSLFQFYYCIGENVPECLIQMQEQYQLYFQSPYDCHPTREITLRLQTYLKNMCLTTTSMKSTTPKNSDGKVPTSTLFSAVVTERGSSKNGLVSPNNSSVAIGRGSYSFTWFLLILVSWILHRWS